jgi:hypothetical protein
MIGWKKPLMKQVFEGKVCRRVPQEMRFLIMIQRIAYFDTFDEPFDNYFRVMRGAAVSLKKNKYTLKLIG